MIMTGNDKLKTQQGLWKIRRKKLKRNCKNEEDVRGGESENKLDRVAQRDRVRDMEG